MKKIIEVTEIQGEGLESLLGQSVLLFCMNYIYTGILTGISETCVLLESPKIVYETGSFKDKDYTDAQSLHTDKWYVQRASIESFGLGK